MPRKGHLNSKHCALSVTQKHNGEVMPGIYQTKFCPFANLSTREKLEMLAQLPHVIFQKKRHITSTSSRANSACSSVLNLARALFYLNLVHPGNDVKTQSSHLLIRVQWVREDNCACHWHSITRSFYATTHLFCKTAASTETAALHISSDLSVATATTKMI